MYQRAYQQEFERKNQLMSDYEVVKRGCKDESEVEARYAAFLRQKARIQAELKKIDTTTKRCTS